tara:strand:+ start:28 stop:468 length:441 start_codon:yes stop_codon:yes gene_type:complete
MKLSTFKKTLSELDTLKFQLPDGHFVPAHFHITEVGNLTRNYIDCGGIVRQENKLSIQLWVASDNDHRLKPDKVLDILKLAEKQFKLSNIDVEVEYQQSTIGRFKLAFDGSVYQLINTNTTCLAQDKCGISQEKARVRFNASGLKL